MSEDDRVLFVCLHGSAKSLIAMQYFNRLAAEANLPMRALSAGIEFDDVVPHEVIEGLRADGIDVSGYQPQGVSASLVASARHIVSFGPDLVQFLTPGCSIELWHDMPLVNDDYATARDGIVARVRGLVERHKAERGMTAA
jgi:protein-tyrosine-phosphatase